MSITPGDATKNAELAVRALMVIVGQAAYETFKKLDLNAKEMLAKLQQPEIALNKANDRGPSTPTFKM